MTDELETYDFDVEDMHWRECSAYLGSVSKDLPPKDTLEKIFLRLDEEIRKDAIGRQVISIERHGPVALPVGHERIVEWTIAVSCRSIDAKHLRRATQTQMNCRLHGSDRSLGCSECQDLERKDVEGK